MGSADGIGGAYDPTPPCVNSFIPVFLACVAGPLLQFVVLLVVRIIRPERSRMGADRTTDLICGALGVAALVVVCVAGMPAVWEIALLFSYFWPVVLRLILRPAERPAP